jgi:hypothetical protein
MNTMSAVLEDLIQRAQAGTLAQATTEELQRFLSAMCWSGASPHFPAPQFANLGETVRLLLLQRHMETLEARSSRYEALVVGLAIASFIASIVQIWLALRST